MRILAIFLIDIAIFYRYYPIYTGIFAGFYVLFAIFLCFHIFMCFFGFQTGYWRNALGERPTRLLNALVKVGTLR